MSRSETRSGIEQLACERVTGRRPARGVVFDLDGVLVLSEHLWDEGWTAYAAAHGYAWQVDDTRSCQGMSVGEWSAYLAERSSGTSEDAARAVIGHVIECYETGRVILQPGAGALVSSVAARVPIALASSAPRAVIDTAMESMGLKPFFSATVSSAEVARGKPNPDVYAEAIRRLGVSSTESIAVEDSSNGIRSATAAGLRTIAIPSREYPLADDAKALAVSIQSSLTGVGEEIGRMLDLHPGGAGET